MKIIHNWRLALKSYSAMALASIGLLVAFWQDLPPELLALIPVEWQKWIVVAIAAIGYIGRFIKQGKEDDLL